MMLLYEKYPFLTKLNKNISDIILEALGVDP